MPAEDVARCLDAQGFADLVERRPGLSIVNFTADRCPPCRVLAPHVDALAREFWGSVVVAKVDVDDHPQLAARFGVRGTPLFFFRDGQVIDRIVGVVPAASLRARVELLRGL